uniref:Uncharacterized protein n=1 Tax=Caenorhabditis japonica TaxID=281687 RepID=A0A8R1E3H9_CAEJA
MAQQNSSGDITTKRQYCLHCAIERQARLPPQRKYPVDSPYWVRYHCHQHNTFWWYHRTPPRNRHTRILTPRPKTMRDPLPTTASWTLAPPDQMEPVTAPPNQYFAPLYPSLQFGVPHFGIFNPQIHSMEDMYGGLNTEPPAAPIYGQPPQFSANQSNLAQRM